jgi:RimJ/RimL family protein N-acetyltransferase
VAEVNLRGLEARDLDAIFAWESDPTAVELAAFTGSQPGDRSAFDARIARILSRPDVLHRAIERDGELVGTIASFTMEGEREVTYWINPACWGQGIASAALGELLVLDQSRPLFARVADHNLGSRRVLERAGFVVIASETSWADGLGREVLERIYRLD